MPCLPVSLRLSLCFFGDYVCALGGISPSLAVVLAAVVAVPGRGGVLVVKHDRSGITVDPCMPTMPGRSASGFHRPDSHCLHQAAP